MYCRKLTELRISMILVFQRCCLWELQFLHYPSGLFSRGEEGRWLWRPPPLCWRTEHRPGKTGLPPKSLHPLPHWHEKGLHWGSLFWIWECLCTSGEAAWATVDRQLGNWVLNPDFECVVTSGKNRMAIDLLIPKFSWIMCLYKIHK